jgi:hypothetical protein
MNVHLNSDLPTANDVPTMHNLTYMTLHEFCRICGIDAGETLQMLEDSEVSFGDAGLVFVVAGWLANLCQIELPRTIGGNMLVEV